MKILRKSSVISAGLIMICFFKLSLNVVAADLVAHWRMDEESNALTLLPDVGSINISLKNGAAAGVEAVDGTGVYMPGGAGQLVDSKTLIPATDDFGVFMWIAFTNGVQPTSQMHLFSCNAGQVNRANFMIIDSGDRLGWFHSGGAGRTGTAKINDGAWHHVGFTRQGGSSQLWVDGVPDSVPSGVNSTPISQEQDWRIGAFVSEMNGLFSGSMDDLRVYHGTLSEQDVFEIVSSYVPTQAVHRWRFDEAAGARLFAPDAGWMAASTLTAPEAGVRAVNDDGVSFDGASALRIPCSKFIIPATNDFSFFMWARDDAETASTSTLLSNNALGSLQPNRCTYGISFSATTSPGKLFLFHPDGTLTGNASIRDRGWHHVGVVRRGSVVELWVDGDLDATRDYGAGFTMSQAQDWRVGAAASESVYFLEGRIDDLRIYTNALSAAEVAGLYDSYTPANTLIAHWRFEDAANKRLLEPEVGWREIYAESLLQVGGQGADGKGLWANTASSGSILGSKKLIPATNDFTVLLWMRTTPSSTPEKHLFTNNGGQAGRCNLTYDAGNANKLTWWVNNTFGLTSVSAGTGGVLDDGVWHQVGISRHGKTFRLWRDGVNVSSATSTAALPKMDQTYDWHIASSARTPPAACYGNTGGTGYALMDDLRVYNYGLDATEVATLYSAFQPTPTAAPQAPATDFTAIEMETEGTVIGHLAQISEESGFTLPTLTVCADGSYLVAATVLSSPIGAHVKVYRSTDSGGTWSMVSEVAPCYGGTLFESGNALYLVGNSNDGGTLIVRRSIDQGTTWTTPTSDITGILTAGTGWHFRAGASTVHDGRIWVYVERRGNTAAGGYPANVEAGALSATVGADLLNAANWSITDPLTPIPASWDTAVTFQGWTDGRSVADKSGTMQMLLHVNTPFGEAEYLALLSTGENPDDALTHTSLDDMVPLPGGGRVFGVRYDKVSRRFWALTNPEGSSRVGLFSSFTLRDWSYHGVIIEAQPGRIQGFMWPSFEIDGDDLISVYRTCYADQDGEPSSLNDLNYVLFKRISDFREIPSDKSEGRLLAADTGNGCVRRYSYDSTNGWLFDDGAKTIFASGVYAGKELTAPYGLAVLGGTVFVSENEPSGRVLAFSRKGAFQRVVYDFGEASTPGALTVSGGMLYVSDEAGDQVWQVNPATGASSIWLATTGTGYALQELRGLACDGAGNLYLADRAGGLILRFNMNGEFSDFVALEAPEALLWDAESATLLATVYQTPDIVTIDTSAWSVTALLDNTIGGQSFRGLAKVNGRMFFTSDTFNRVNRQLSSSSYTSADIRLDMPGHLLLLSEGAEVYPEAALGLQLIVR